MIEFTHAEITKICQAIQNLVQITLGCQDDSYLAMMLKPIIYEEFEKADSADTKNTIQRRVLNKAAKALNFQSGEKSNGIVISNLAMAMLDQLYEQTKTNDIKLNVLHTKYMAFKNQDTHDMLAVKNLIREFQKDNEIVKENSTNKRDKILKNNYLNAILAVDGMNGYHPVHLVNYIPHLSVGDVAQTVHEKHVMAIRDMYKYFPSTITGTDSVYILAKLLLEMYSPFIKDLNYQFIVKSELEMMENYLFKQAEHFTIIKEIQGNEEFISRMKERYCAHISRDELEHIANDRVTKLATHLSKQKNNTETTSSSSQKRKKSSSSEITENNSSSNGEKKAKKMKKVPSSSQNNA